MVPLGRERALDFFPILTISAVVKRDYVLLISNLKIAGPSERISTVVQGLTPSVDGEAISVGNKTSVNVLIVEKNESPGAGAFQLILNCQLVGLVTRYEDKG